MPDRQPADPPLTLLDIIPPDMDGYYLADSDGATVVRFFKAGDTLPPEAHTAFQASGGALRVGDRVLAHATLTRLS